MSAIEEKRKIIDIEIKFEDLVYNITKENLDEIKSLIPQLRKSYVTEILADAAAERIFSIPLLADLWDESFKYYSYSTFAGYLKAKVSIKTDDTIIVNNVQDDKREFNQEVFSVYAYPKPSAGTSFSAKADVTVESQDKNQFLPDKVALMEVNRIYSTADEDYDLGNGGLSAGAIAGIVIACVVVVGVVIFLIVWFVVLKKGCCCSGSKVSNEN